MEKKFSIRVLAEVAIFAAIAFALDLIQSSLFGKVWVNGGSIGIAMVPIFVIAYRRGLLAGLLCGFIVSIVQMLGGVYVFQGKTFDNKFMEVMGPFFQISLDYILAYTVVGFAGLFYGMYHNSNSTSKKLLAIILGCLLGGTLKFLCHFMAGGFFWLDGYTKFMGLYSDSWLYSFVYNGTCVFPSTILSVVIMVIIAKFYEHLLLHDKNEADLNYEEVNETENNISEVSNNEQE